MSNFEDKKPRRLAARRQEDRRRSSGGKRTMLLGEIHELLLDFQCTTSFNGLDSYMDRAINDINRIDRTIRALETIGAELTASILVRARDERQRKEKPRTEQGERERLIFEAGLVEDIPTLFERYEASFDEPNPNLHEFEVFHLTADKEASHRVASELKEAGIRIKETVGELGGRPEYAVEVPPDDIVKVSELIEKGFGPGDRVFMSPQ
jgi:hypothetical protein